MKEKNHENNKSDLLLGKYPLQETFTTNMICNGSAHSISIAERASSAGVLHKNCILENRKDKLKTASKKQEKDK